MKKVITWGGIALVAVGAIIASRAIVWNDADTVLVISRMGAIQDEPLTREGYHFINPWDSAIKLPIRGIPHKMKADAATAKGQTAPAEITATYFVKPHMWPKVYREIGGVSAINAVLFDGNVNQSVKQVTGGYQAEELIHERPLIKASVGTNLQSSVDDALKRRGLDGAIEINSVGITDFGFSKDFNDAINRKVESEQRALQAESEAEQKSILARANADAENTQTDAKSYAAEVLSKARSEALELKGAALKESGGAVLKLRCAEQWKGKLPKFFDGDKLPFGNCGSASASQQK